LPQDVIRAMAQPMIHHRWPAYADLHRQVVRGLRYVLQTENEILLLTSSGTGAMEAAVANLHRPEDTVLVVRGGKFADRWAKICKAYGLNVISIDIPWGEAMDPQAVAKHLEVNKDIKTVFATSCETSTGVAHDLAAVAEITKSHTALLIVDAISGLCSEELHMDQWQVDVVISATQKGLMCPPGISFVSLNEAAWKRTETASLPKFYWNFVEMRKFSQRNQTLFTPAITTLYALKAALDLIQAEGLDNFIARHAHLAESCRAAVTALGLNLFAQRPANALTAVRVPQGVDGIKLLQHIHNHLGATIAGGQAHLRGKIFRLAHLGHADELDLIAAIAILERGLAAVGHDFTAGAGLLAVQGLSDTR
jgi:aspartate aminotransferase-like enzyme